MVIFHSYVELPEGNGCFWYPWKKICRKWWELIHSWEFCDIFGAIDGFDHGKWCAIPWKMIEHHQSRALFLAICYILEQKPEYWIFKLKIAICTVHQFFHGFRFSCFFSASFTHCFHRFVHTSSSNWVFHRFDWCFHGFNQFSMYNMHLLNM